MYRKIAIKIRVLTVCVLFLLGLINTFIGISIINTNQELLGFFVLLGGCALSLMLFSLIFHICDIVDDLYYAVRKIKKKTESVSKDE